MSGIVQSLFGGSSTDNPGGSSSSSGISNLTPQIIGAFNNLAGQAQTQLGNVGQAGSNFVNANLTQPAQTALNQLVGQNFAPTASSISSDVAAQMNPYDSSVINSIENAQNGQESQLNSYLTAAGQFGSNRGMLGASDISQRAADQIGTFKNNEFQTAVNNALTTLPQARTNAAETAYGVGTQQQSLATQNQQAPYSALTTLAKILSVLPNSASQSASTGASQTTDKGIIPAFASFVPKVG